MKSRRYSVPTDSAADMLSDCLGVRLQSLRRLRGTTQLTLAERLQIGQTALSHLERRDDILLSTLIAYTEALGGRLQIAATFSDANPVKLFGKVDWAPAPAGALDADNDQPYLPIILGPEQLPPSRDVIFSIRPAHAEKILDGTKTVELRRRFTSGLKPGTLALIYATSPIRALTGFAKIQDIQCLALNDLWKKHRSAACLGKGDFENYFSGLKRGYAIVLDSAKALHRPVGLPELRERFGFEPPQSYQYASPYMRGLVEHEWPQAPL